MLEIVIFLSYQEQGSQTFRSKMVTVYLAPGIKNSHEWLSKNLFYKTIKQVSILHAIKVIPQLDVSYTVTFGAFNIKWL